MTATLFLEMGAVAVAPWKLVDISGNRSMQLISLVTSEGDSLNPKAGHVLKGPITLVLEQLQADAENGRKLSWI